MRCLFSREVEGRQGGGGAPRSKDKSPWLWVPAAPQGPDMLNALATMAVRPGIFSAGEMEGA